MASTLEQLKAAIAMLPTTENPTLVPSPAPGTTKVQQIVNIISALPENAPIVFAQKPKKTEKPKTEKPVKLAVTKAPEPVILPGSPELVDLSQLDFVVGQIKSVRKHPGADSLYIEQIDVGEHRGGERQILSGLVKFMTEDEMLNRFLIVVANLKPSALRGEISNGMVLCASDNDKTKVVFVTPPPGSKPGDRIVPIDSTLQLGTPAASVNAKSKVNAWSTVAPDLHTNEKGELCYGTIVLGVNSVPATAVLTDSRVQ